MVYKYNGEQYSSKKHPVLEFIFNKYWQAKVKQNEIYFTLKDISDGYKATGIIEPASISNTILDLTRKAAPIHSRVPPSIYNRGYDLKKKTGKSPDGNSYAGAFVFVGIGNEIQSWLRWPNSLPSYTVDSSNIPSMVKNLLRKDEGALFSVIDYCDVFSKVLYNGCNQITRVQNPMKWQPNEIDGFYYGNINGIDTVFPVEAKALTTRDDINLVQLEGGIRTVLSKLDIPNTVVVPIAIQMIKNGMRIAVFQQCSTHDVSYNVKLEKSLVVTFNPAIEAWQ